MSLFFNGRLIVSPATVSRVDDSAMFNKNGDVGNVLAIVGTAKGGQPNTALRFGSPKDAADVLIDGEGLKAVQLAFDASAETNSPAEIVFVRVNPATQASLALLNSSSAAVIDLVSTGYGLRNNGIKVKVENGTTVGKKVTTQFGDDLYVGDNLIRNAFSIRYTGSESTAVLTTAATSLSVTLGSNDPVSIDLNSFPTIGELVDRLNAITGITATVLDGNDQKPALNGLDGFSSQDIKTATVTITGTLQAIIDWLNGNGEGFITATRHSGALAVPANIAFTYLSGAVDGTVTNTEWQNAFDTLQSIDAQWIVPLSSNAAIHAMADTHVAFMSNVGKKERRAICGMALGTTDAQAIAAAKLINSDRTSLTHLGLYDYNAAGAFTLYAPYFMAAMIGGAFAGVSPGTPLTNKSLKIAGIERKLRNPVDTDLLINGGVLAVEDTATGFKVVKSISTWLVNNNFNRVEVSTGAATDFVARTVREALDPLRGSKATPTLLAEYASRTDTVLRGLAEPEPTGPGIIVGDKVSPAYKGITVSLDGDVVSVDFQCSPAIPNNYTAVTIHTVPYKGTASA